MNIQSERRSNRATSPIAALSSYLAVRAPDTDAVVGTDDGFLLAASPGLDLHFSEAIAGEAALKKSGGPIGEALRSRPHRIRASTGFVIVTELATVPSNIDICDVERILAA
jgi:hypothetical protein